MTVRYAQFQIKKKKKRNRNLFNTHFLKLGSSKKNPIENWYFKSIFPLIPSFWLYYHFPQPVTFLQHLRINYIQASYHFLFTILILFLFHFIYLVHLTNVNFLRKWHFHPTIIKCSKIILECFIFIKCILFNYFNIN